MEKRYFFAALIVTNLFLVYSIFLSFGSLEGTPKSLTGNPHFPYLQEKPLSEDGYYMMTIAWNIAEGKGFKYNYGIKTTGVQPLATIIYSVPAFLVQKFNGGKYLFARMVIILSALLEIVFAFLVYLLAREISKSKDKGLIFLISFCVVLLNFKVLLNFANGLETGLYLILLSLFFLYWIKYKTMQLKIAHLIGLGLLTGLLLLCRLDSVILLFTFYLLLLYKNRIRLKYLVSIVIIALLLYLPWQLYVWNVTGNLLQSSARSQTALFPFFNLPYKFEQYFSSIIQHFTPFLFTGNIQLWLIFPMGIVYLAVLIRLYVRRRSFIIPLSTEKIIGMILISFSVLAIIYFFFSSAPHFYFRYTAYLMVLSFPVIVVLFADIIKKLNPLLIYLALIILLINFGIQAYLYLHSGNSARAFTVRVEFVNNNFSENARIAAFQTGVLGYYCDNVFNLDGKIDNSALESFSNGGIGKYIDKMNIDVLMEWKDFVPVLFKKEYLDKYWKLYAEDIGDGRTCCYVRKNLKL